MAVPLNVHHVDDLLAGARLISPVQDVASLWAVLIDASEAIATRGVHPQRS
jgi:hypothetical protein